MEPCAPRRRSRSIPTPWVGGVKPFLIETVAVPLGGPERAHERCVHRRLQRGEGARRGRHDDLDRTSPVPDGHALFWTGAGGLTGALQLVTSSKTTISILPKAPGSLAMMNLAAADAAINCWNDKYHFGLLAARQCDPPGRTRTATRRLSAGGVGRRCGALRALITRRGTCAWTVRTWARWRASSAHDAFGSTCRASSSPDHPNHYTTVVAATGRIRRPRRSGCL